MSFIFAKAFDFAWCVFAVHGQELLFYDRFAWGYWAPPDSSKPLRSFREAQRYAQKKGLLEPPTKAQVMTRYDDRQTGQLSMCCFFIEKAHGKWTGEGETWKDLVTNDCWLLSWRAGAVDADNFWKVNFWKGVECELLKVRCCQFCCRGTAISCRWLWGAGGFWQREISKSGSQ